MTVADRPNIPGVLERFADYFSQPGNGAWGSLHSVLDDANVSDKNVASCFERAMELNDHEGAELAKVLLQMSRTQRIKLPYAVNTYVKSLKDEPKAPSPRF